MNDLTTFPSNSELIDLELIDLGVEIVDTGDMPWGTLGSFSSAGSLACAGSTGSSVSSGSSLSSAS